MIKKYTTSKFATNLNLESTNPTKCRNKKNCVFDTWKQNARNAQWNALKMKKSLKHRHKQTELEI